jgi:hypothetical protein
MHNKSILVAALALLAFGTFAATTLPTVAFAGEVNPAHDADNGNGNEKSLGTCKQEANNDNACTAKK